jgi:hypothetical protein
MTLSHQEAARLLGMKTREVVSVDPFGGDCVLVTLHDGTETPIRAGVVGESGPELVEVPSAGEVHNSTETKKTLGEQVTDALVTDVPTGTIDEILSWVDGDPERALQALRTGVVEQEREKPRSTLAAKLEELMSQ